MADPVSQPDEDGEGYIPPVGWLWIDVIDIPETEGDEEPEVISLEICGPECFEGALEAKYNDNQEE
jgi:hypothetical protein